MGVALRDAIGSERLRQNTRDGPVDKSVTSQGLFLAVKSKIVEEMYVSDKNNRGTNKRMPILREIIPDDLVNSAHNQSVERY